jgi:hypothetical protein
MRAGAKPAEWGNACGQPTGTPPRMKGEYHDDAG